MEKLGVAKGAELDVDTMADRLRQQTVGAGATLHLTELIAAWSRVP
jgi:hypothetical protein